MVSKSLSNYTNNIFCFKLKTIFYSEIITLKLLIIKNLTIGLVPFEWTVCLFVHILGGVWVHVWDSHYSDFFISHNPSTGGSWITGWATAPRRWSHCEGYLLNQHTFYRLQSQPIKHSFFFFSFASELNSCLEMATAVFGSAHPIALSKTAELSIQGPFCQQCWAKYTCTNKSFLFIWFSSKALKCPVREFSPIKLYTAPTLLEGGNILIFFQFFCY